ncbi:lycopene cyclase domain-containing protein [Cellulomonas carbonis]|uniref:C50 carotenoid epsilon cyclase n=1 Tax=Cellulomonas carbonis T26 TaxID=947969 RepID=A0A0A0BRC5_9CELL|nr:lycopene cyclase domain-containing protein [Cellulomonas carbonis]KGM09649.1 C50 carotenoid epsilon cyclase [Cellulomonas carbonis T26]GGC07033.1 lycopene cyclase [Cellulomonas carbonis]
MTGLLYLAALAVSITGMVVLDRRFALFFFDDARRAAVVLAVGVGTFLVWDLLGIGLGVFFRGETRYMTGVQLAPELPVEEVFFLVLLSYLTMNVWAGARRVAEAHAGRRDSPSSSAGPAGSAGSPSAGGVR